MKIKFTLDCFKDTFMDNILNHLGYNNYYEYLNSDNNNPEFFILDITSISPHKNG